MHDKTKHTLKETLKDLKAKLNSDRPRLKKLEDEYLEAKVRYDALKAMVDDKEATITAVEEDIAAAKVITGGEK